ncbi:uncharacterized protein [Nicotiana tomentosiformis]|uniref:uncharacterized protein n=1 Tax=Nicotiana tomentosiformis TaxID=4098 RepID=UPI00388C9CB7
MSKHVLSDRLARWYLQFQQFEIPYVPQKVVKGQALADFLVDHPIPDDWELSDELPDEDAMVIEIQPPWKMYFYGIAHCEGAGAGIVFITSQGETQVVVCQRWVVPLPNDYEEEESEVEHLASVLEALLHCLGDDESLQALQEAHSGVCGDNQSGPKLHFHIKRMGYYWPTMMKDCLDYARRCKSFQFHANFIHQPPEGLHPTVASWPFEAWGLDVVGLLPKSSGGHLYILAATDYFSKWAEAVSLKEVKKENVANFI